jgi:RNA polymerase sigma-70 factor, ECF subfamily
MSESKPGAGHVPEKMAAAGTRGASPGLWSRDAAWVEYIERAGMGEQEALASLYDESCSLVYSLALRILGNPADAEEVTLDVYSQVWRDARKFDRQRGTAGAWLATLSRSRAIDRVRSGTTRRTREEQFRPLTDFPDPAARPDEAGALEQQRRLIQAALDALAPEQREAIELAYFSGFSHSELAARLGQPLGTVKTRIRLGMMKLRELLQPIAFGSRRADVWDMNG